MRLVSLEIGEIGILDVEKRRRKSESISNTHGYLC